jgi:hypothetical protein
MSLTNPFPMLLLLETPEASVDARSRVIVGGDFTLNAAYCGRLFVFIVIIVALSVSLTWISISLELRPGGATTPPAQEPNISTTSNRPILLRFILSISASSNFFPYNIKHTVFQCIIIIIYFISIFYSIS